MALLISAERALFLTGEKTLRDIDLFATIVSDVDARVKKYLGRELIVGTYTQYAKKSTIALKEYPVTSITSIKIADDQSWSTTVALTTDDYRYDVDTGIVYLYEDISSRWEVVQIVYVGGYTTIPDPILRAVAKQSIFEYRNKNGIGTVQMKTGDETTTIEYEKSSGLLLEVANALDLYRDHNI